MNKSYCRDCHKKGKGLKLMEAGKALLNRLVVHSDFPGDYSGEDISKAQRGQTMSRTGRAQMINVLKCPECGRSVRF